VHAAAQVEMMRPMSERSDDEPESLSGASSPVPERWVTRAIEIPALERALAILGDAEDAEEMRSALEAVGLEADDGRVGALRRLKELRASG
jgi:hypothetical protein